MQEPELSEHPEVPKHMDVARAGQMRSFPLQWSSGPGNDQKGFGTWRTLHLQ